MSKTVIRAITGVEAGDGPRPKLPRGSLSHFARPQRFVFFIYKREQRKTGLFGKDAKHQCHRPQLHARPRRSTLAKRRPQRILDEAVSLARVHSRLSTPTIREMKGLPVVYLHCMVVNF